jgi:hypothetical protein
VAHIGTLNKQATTVESDVDLRLSEWNVEEPLPRSLFCYPTGITVVHVYCGSFGAYRNQCDKPSHFVNISAADWICDSATSLEAAVNEADIAPHMPRPLLNLRNFILDAGIFRELVERGYFRGERLVHHNSAINRRPRRAADTEQANDDSDSAHGFQHSI